MLDTNMELKMLRSFEEAQSPSKYSRIKARIAYFRKHFESNQPHFWLYDKGRRVGFALPLYPDTPKHGIHRLPLGHLDKSSVTYLRLLKTSAIPSVTAQCGMLRHLFYNAAKYSFANDRLSLVIKVNAKDHDMVESYKEMGFEALHLIKGRKPKLLMVGDVYDVMRANQPKVQKTDLPLPPFLTRHTM